ncbi:ferric reductase [Nocardioides sp.]|uniref:ferric reductase n=1 Tax=Nocardioides sp. TaxID=35761 RepID=UPI003783BC39
MTDGPVLWFLNRGTGISLLVLLTVTVVLGLLSRPARAGRTVPAFVPQHLHRNLALLSVVALGVHVTTAVVDSYVDIRWWQALVPVGATYEPLWLGLGTVSLDLIAITVVTSLLRGRIGLRSWRVLHLLTWPAWAMAVVHGVGIGTDLRDGAAWAVWPTVACCAAVAAALVVRLAAGSPAAVGSRP